MIQTPFNIETEHEVAVVVDLKDPLKQGRVKISTASLYTTPIANLPWCKALSTHSQTSSKQGGTIESAHSLKTGDVIMVNQPTATQQEWILSGHPGSVADFQGVSSGVTSSENYAWNTDLKTGDTKSAKPKTTKTTYPTTPTYAAYQPPKFEVDQGSKNVRGYAKKMIGSWAPSGSPASQSAAGMAEKAKELFSKGNNITQAFGEEGNPVTRVIQKHDENYYAEAQQSGNVVQMLHKLREEGNQQDFGGFPQQAQNGLMKTIQSLIGGQMFGILNQMGQLAMQTGSQQNSDSQQDKNTPQQVVNANGQIIFI